MVADQQGWQGHLLSGSPFTASPLRRISANLDAAALVPERPGRHRELLAAREALAALDRLGKARDRERGPAESRELTEVEIRDPDLIEAVRHLVRCGPYRVRCAGCDALLGYIALTPFVTNFGTIVVSGHRLVPAKQRQGGALDLVMASRPQVALGADGMVLDAAAGVGNVTPIPDGPWGATLGRSRIYRCKKCDKTSVALNRRLLVLVLDAVVNSKSQVSL